MTRLERIYRYPIKSHGREALKSVALTRGQTIPFDRVWAVAHEAAKLASNRDDGWLPCASFSRGAKAPQLMAITASVNENDNSVALQHPDLTDISLNLHLAEDRARLIAWVLPICPTNRALPSSVYNADERGLTDSDFPSVSINSLASLRALNEKAGANLAPERFRGNLWIDGIAAWAEFDWIDREIEIGGAKLRGIERIERCTATTANPETGQVDFDTLGHLQNDWGHLDFGIRAEVIESGKINVGDAVST